LKTYVIMIPGLSGNLVTEYFVEEFFDELFGSQVDRGRVATARASLLRQRRLVRDRLGPVCGPRQVHDLVTLPLTAALEYGALSACAASSGRFLLAGASPGPVVATAAWGENLDPAWREALRFAPATEWCLSTNGCHLRIDDGRRSHVRRFSQFDLDLAFEDDRLFCLLWLLLHCASFSGAVPSIQRVVAASDGHAVGVCRSLRDGVLSGLAELLGAFVFRPRRRRAGPVDLASAHEQSLTIVYRLLFLLFAESRLLVPSWHPVYRDGYSLDAARALAEQAGPAAGLWEMLQAISRISHAGCRAGDLHVTPFNGRLFSPAATPLAEHAVLDDEPVRRTLLALSTTPRSGGRARIVYRDLDVEQLGAVYESVLDYAPAFSPDRARVELRAGSGLRKSTATFYTPRALTSYLVRRALAPLVAGVSPEQVLSLRVVDPAMGSGAFLVAACRYLAGAYEAAIVQCGRALAGEIDEKDRCAFRRAVAQRCLYGADSNPMAVQLARLSIWLATLAPDRPLTFLDHRLVVGDSLVGASLDDLRRRPAPGRLRGRAAAAPLPLFDEIALGPALRAVLPARARVADRADDTLAVVREKEETIAGLSGTRSPLAPWKAVLDLWCAQSGPGGAHASAGLFGALADHLLLGRSPLDAKTADLLVAEHSGSARLLSPLHWSLEFPEVFYGDDGSPLARAGFDAVVGNPPWDMIRADEDGPAGRADARRRAAWLLRFSRDSGIYRAQGEGHANRFQLFVERALQLVRLGGRVGLVVPWGLLGDAGCAPLRRLLFDATSLDPVVGFDNGDRIFPIHRSVRFLALCATSGGSTTSLAARFGERDASVLDHLATDGRDGASFPVVLSRSLIERLSGESLAIPDVREPDDLALLDKLSRAGPPLASPDGWHARFGRELNATDDRSHFLSSRSGLPVLEGKHVTPFRAERGPGRAVVPAAVAERLLGGARPFAQPRLAYRDVSSPTNRLTLIAAVVPSGCVTVHSLFCLRSGPPLAAHHFLCGVLNSLVANYYVRFWVSSHVTTAIVGRLPVPMPGPASASFDRIAALARALSRESSPCSTPEYARLQAEVATLYGVTEGELRRILASFPLIDQNVRVAVLEQFTQRAG
jgi:hypothetical protein